MTTSKKQSEDLWRSTHYDGQLTGAQLCELS